MGRISTRMNESDLFFEILKKSLMFQSNREPEKDNEVLKRNKISGLNKNINKK